MQQRSCYVNFAEHLLSAFNPNMTYPRLRYRWGEAEWFNFIDMIAAFGFNTFEFWLTPRLFSPAGMAEDWGEAFAREICAIIEHAARRDMAVKMLCGLTTVGAQWHTHCPRVREEWDECVMLWDQWTKRLPGLGVVGIFPGDPGGCSRNGCDARTFIDGALQVAEVIKRNLPQARIELGTWGSPFFGWGNMKVPPDWQGEFIQSIQGTGWDFDRKRADDAMGYLLKKLPAFPDDTSVAISLAFTPDGDPQEGPRDARQWAREIARTRPIVTWDYSLTEGEDAVIPHHRFRRLFERRKQELAAAPYQGGMCYTMTPLLNQLSLYQSAQSFLNPQADHRELTRRFYLRLFGPEAAAELVETLPLFEIIPDWGNHEQIDVPNHQLHTRMKRTAEMLRACEGHVACDQPLHPAPEQYRQTLLFFCDLFADLSAVTTDFSALRERYWRRVYGIYDDLPEHVDPRPRRATEKLIGFFATRSGVSL